MRITRFANLALIGVALLAASCQQTSVATKHQPARIDSTEVKGIMRVTLDARAAERIGLQMAPVLEETVVRSGSPVSRKVVPYGAVMYDTHGDTWTFTSRRSLEFVRQPVVVENIVGDRAILSEGPAAGTSVVTVGAAQLMAAEHKYGL